MRIVEILNGLQEVELHEFKEVTVSDARQYQAKLLDILLQRLPDGPWPAEEVFPLLFGIPYRSDQDYRLRNEYRHLLRRLRFFLAEKEFSEVTGESEAVGAPFFLRRLMGREAEHAFDLEYRRAVRMARKAGDVRGELDLLRMEAQRVRRTARTRKDIERLLQLSHEFRDLVEVQHQRDKWQSLEWLAFAERNLVAYGYETGLTDLRAESASIEDFPDPYLQFLVAKSLSYHSFGADYIQATREALDRLEPVKVPGFDKGKERATLLSNLALSHFLAGDYATARKYFRQIIRYRDQIPRETYGAMLFNYISAILHDKDYQEATQLIREEIVAFRNHPQIEVRIVALEAISFIYLEKPKEARRVVLSVLDQAREGDLYYLRICLMIAWYQEGDVFAALREGENILQSLRRGGEFRIYRLITDLFNRYLRLQGAPDSKRTARQRTKLDNLRSEFELDEGVDGTGTLPVKWILNELHRVL